MKHLGDQALPCAGADAPICDAVVVVELEPLDAVSKRLVVQLFIGGDVVELETEHFRVRAVCSCMRLLGRRPRECRDRHPGAGSTADNALREGLSFRSSLIDGLTSRLAACRVFRSEE